MFSVTDFLDRAKAGAGDVTDYRLAKLLGVTHSAVSTWRTGTRAPDERAIEALCKLSGDDPEHVAACIQSMRAANDDAADLWRRVADRLAKRANVIAMIGFALLFVAATPERASAAPLSSSFDGLSLYIMSN
jgi:predicted transcriptional regulator